MRLVNSAGTKQNTADELEQHVLGMYFSLRQGIILVAAAFPLWLLGAGAVYYGIPWQGSMSAYYHAAGNDDYQGCQESFRKLTVQNPSPSVEAIRNDPKLQQCRAAHYGGGSMRNWFVGILFAVGVFLYLYKGFSTTENYALNIAVAFALGIALNPMELWEKSSGVSWHGFFAVSFFIVIAFVAIFC